MKERSFVEASKDGQRGMTSPSDPIADSIAPDLVDLDGAYLAHARASNKPVQALHCVLGKDGVRSFQYVHLDSDSQFRRTSSGQAILIRFAGIKAVQVTIRGRNLWRLFDYLHQHRMPWIRLADRDFSGDQEPIITAIEIEEAA